MQPLDDHIKWMERAIWLASEAEKIDEVPVGAVLVYKNELLAEGMNFREQGKTLGHAELMALENYNFKSKSWRLPPGTTLFVTVEPCLMCTGAFISARLSHLVYGCSDTKNAGLSRLRPMIDEGIFDHRFESITCGVKSIACSKLMTDYFERKRLAESPHQFSTQPSQK